MPGSLASSQVSSPRSLGQPSLQALSAMKLAQYRGAGRVGGQAGGINTSFSLLVEH